MQIFKVVEFDNNGRSVIIQKAVDPYPLFISGTMTFLNDHLIYQKIWCTSYTKKYNKHIYSRLQDSSESLKDFGAYLHFCHDELYLYQNFLPAQNLLWAFLA